MIIAIEGQEYAVEATVAERLLVPVLLGQDLTLKQL